jgi:hypothetical protein
MGSNFEYPVFGVEVLADQTVNVDFGGTGVVVAGKLVGVDSYQGVTIAMQPPPPDRFGWAKLGQVGADHDLRRGFSALRESDYAPLYFRDSLPVAADGSFRIEDVMTGRFELTVSGSATGRATFTVNSQQKDLIELEPIEVKSRPAVNVQQGREGS